MKKSRLIRVVSNKIFVVKCMLFTMPWEPRNHPNGLILWLNRSDDSKRCILYVIRHASKEENTTGKVCIEKILQVSFSKFFTLKKLIFLRKWPYPNFTGDKFDTGWFLLFRSLLTYFQFFITQVTEDREKKNGRQM